VAAWSRTRLSSRVESCDAGIDRAWSFSPCRQPSHTFWKALFAWATHRSRAHHLDAFYSQYLTARALGHHRKDSKFLPWPPPRAISRQASDLRATRHPPSPFRLRLIGIVAAASLSKHTYLPMMATLRRICELSAHSHHFPRLQQRILARTRSWPLFPAPLQHIQDQVESATSATLVS
jgi:hypothetical protein